MSKEPSAKKQISADLILLDAYDHKDAPVQHADYKFNDMEELKDYQLRIRTSYEKALQFKRTDLPQYIRYAKWEWELHNYNRGRSIFERAINVDHANIKVWINYINLEISSKNINHARNLLERVITLLPRVDKFYYEYIQLEEKLGNYGNVHEIFERWLKWKPLTNIYDNYIRFLVKYRDLDKARLIYEQLIRSIPTVENFIKYINFEIKNGTTISVRNLFDLIIENLIKIDKLDNAILIKYLDFETRQENFAKVRQIYKFALTVKNTKSDEIYEAFNSFEKQYGSKTDIEHSVLIKRKLKYETDSHTDLEDWWSYLDIVEELGELSESNFEKCLTKASAETETGGAGAGDRDIYVLIWLRYLYFVELKIADVEKTRSLYKRLTKEFGINNTDIYINYANFELRRGNLLQLRKIHGYCLGKFKDVDNKRVILLHYIDLELQLRQFDRVRKIFESYLSVHSGDIEVWFQYIDLEISLEESERADSIFQIVIGISPKEDMFKVYKKYLQFLHESMQYGKTRIVYENLIAKTHSNVNIYISYLMNELLIPTAEQLKEIQSDNDVEEFDITKDQIDKLDQIFNKGLSFYKSQKDVNNRAVLYESYKTFIKNYQPDKYDDVIQRAPKLVKQYIEGEEKLVFVFNDDDDATETAIAASSFLENARKWMLEQG